MNQIDKDVEENLKYIKELVLKDCEGNDDTWEFYKMVIREMIEGHTEKCKRVAEDLYQWLEFYKGSSYTEWHKDTDKAMNSYEQLKAEEGK